MADIPLEFGPEHPDLSRFVYKALTPLVTGLGRVFDVYRENSRYALERCAAMRQKLEAGETVYLLGINSGIHNSGVSLLRVSRDNGMEMLSNDEEERFTGVKHEERYPQDCVEVLKERMSLLGIGPEDIHAVITGWAQMEMGAFGAKAAFEHAPVSIRLGLRAKHSPEMNLGHVMPGLITSVKLGKQFGLKKPVKMISSPHHDNHACASYALSPFNGDDNVMVTVIDAFSDTGGISTFLSKNSRVIKQYENSSFFDSLGVLYSVLASALGGWKRLSSEGRLMGLSGFGDMNRETNPFYRDLRNIIRLTEEGSIEINRALLNTPRGGALAPYTKALEAILGPPIREEELWNPDSDEVFTSEKIRRDIPEATLHKAAALQLVFEDGVFYIVESLIRRSYLANGTASNQLVLTGGTALNCVVNNKLLFRFDRDWYRKNFGEDKTLHVWVPPFPGDAGVAPGAAFAFAVRSGAPMGPGLQHAFYVGLTPSTRSIREAIDADTEINALPLGNVKRSREELERIAGFVAELVANDQIVGLFQGEGETGPRALGHRSILANPTRRDSLNLINQMVKRREAFRPLAPFGTLEAVLEHCEIDPVGGLSDDDFNALNYMVFAVGVKPQSAGIIPAVVHEDGTLRAQVVRERTDPFTYAYLKALGGLIGVEMSINTSFNIGSAIVQTPRQAIATLKRSKGMAGVVMMGGDGEACIAYHEVENGLKDRGRQLREFFRQWRGE
jgi:carbamoyltransferase